MVPRRLGVEFVGTALLLIAVVGSGIAAQRLSPNDIGLELLEKSIATGAADWPQSSSRIEMALASVTASCDRQVRVMASAVIQRPSFRLLVPSAIILANYVAQIPYDLHLYGTSVSARGGGLLVLTLMWFVAGLWLLVRGNPAGYWLTMSFLATDFGFYLYNLVGGWVHGYGLFFHILRFSDPILWTVFMIGYANFFATGYLIMHLIRNRPKLPMRSRESSARTR